MPLSKLHVRFIQSQQQFTLKTDSQTSFDISSLYVKDMEHFYLVIKDENLCESPTAELIFKEKTPALNHLNCQVSIKALEEQSEDYEDALLFFNADPSTVNQLLLLKLEGFEAA